MLVKGATGGTWSSAHISIHVRDICLPAWWRHQMAALLALYADNSLVTVEVSWQRPVTQTFDVFFDLRLNKRLSNNRDAEYLRRHRAHYDFTVMEYSGWCNIRLTFRKFTVLVKIYIKCFGEHELKYRILRFTCFNGHNGLVQNHLGHVVFSNSHGSWNWTAVHGWEIFLFGYKLETFGALMHFYILCEKCRCFSFWVKVNVLGLIPSFKKTSIYCIIHNNCVEIRGKRSSPM